MKLRNMERAAVGWDNISLFRLGWSVDVDNRLQLEMGLTSLNSTGSARL
jgi:hypothetical protein